MQTDFLPAEYQIPYEDELKSKNFNRILDHYLLTNHMDSEAYETLTPVQLAVIQTIKRAIKRIKQ